MSRNTYPHLKQKDIATIVHRPSSNGQMTEKYASPKRLEGKDSTISMILKESPVLKKKLKLQKEKPSVMQESPRENKKKISEDKSNTSKNTVPTVPLSKTSGLGSTIIEKDYNLSLKKLHQEISKKLSLPIEIGYVDTGLNSSTGYSLNIMSNSWFSAKKLTLSTQRNLPPTSSTSATTSSPNTMGKKLPNIDQKEIVLRQIKIRLRVNGRLKRYMMRADSAVRFLYNKAVELEIQKEKVSLKNFRQKLLNDSPTNILSSRMQRRLKKVPYDIRDEAIRDFCTAYKTQIQLVSQGKRKHFSMKFRRRKCDRTFVLHKKHFKITEEKIYCYTRMWKKRPILTYSEEIPPINHDCRVLVTRDNKFYLIIPIDIEIQKKKENFSICSLDPGVRIFQTGYDTEGNSFFFGENDIEQIDHLGNIASRMRNGIKRKWDGDKRVFKKVSTKKEKIGLMKAAYKVEIKIKNMISDCHRKTAKFLCENYDHVIIPEFKTQNMVRKKKRCIGKTTVRKMMHWSHYSFRELLINKGAVTGTNVIVGTEEYTSKTCGNCFFVNEKVGRDKLSCSQCKITIHRDVNAARNIMLLNWKKLPEKISTMTVFGRPNSKRNRQI